ncbi:hypothetical protein L596_027513 [Steinernema carpocapsae]|uniref:DUF4794 domain-containing protein n=1 Tax=Steinernema carpocapsae TaxID=34508 RepID=A0A4V5ZXT0_STECR|nr:hypothetical protein L596_027513 [Steinernema carpocapsae]
MCILQSSMLSEVVFYSLVSLVCGQYALPQQPSPSVQYPQPVAVAQYKEHSQVEYLPSPPAPPTHAYENRQIQFIDPMPQGRVVTRLTRRYFVPVGPAKVIYNTVTTSDRLHPFRVLSVKYSPTQSINMLSDIRSFAPGTHIVPTGPKKVYHRLILPGTSEYARIKSLVLDQQHPLQVVSKVFQISQPSDVPQPPVSSPAPPPPTKKDYFPLPLTNKNTPQVPPEVAEPLPPALITQVAIPTSDSAVEPPAAPGYNWLSKFC